MLGNELCWQREVEILDKHEADDGEASGRCQGQGREERVLGGCDTADSRAPQFQEDSRDNG
jgi:hypothetical protein